MHSSSGSRSSGSASAGGAAGDANEDGLRDGFRKSVSGKDNVSTTLARVRQCREKPNVRSTCTTPNCTKAVEKDAQPISPLASAMLALAANSRHSRL
eukprot:5298160-Amphidinium_carterae.1